MNAPPILVYRFGMRAAMLLLIAFFASGFSTSRGQSPIRPLATGTHVPGSVFTVDIHVGSSQQPVSSLFGVSFELVYDNAVLVFVDDEAGPFMGDSPVYASDHDAQAGRIGVGVSRKQGETSAEGDGSVAQIRFRVLPDIQSGTFITFTLENVAAVDPSDMPVALNAEPLDFAVVSPSESDVPLLPTAITPQAAGATFWVEVVAGTAENPVENLFGLSFELAYNPQQATLIRHEAGDFLGTNALYSANDNRSAGVVGVGMSRTAGAGGVNESGVVMRALFQLDDNITPGTEVLFSTQGIQATDPAGGALFLDPQTMSVAVASSQDPVSLIYPQAVSPQPTGGVFWVDIYAGSDALPVDDLFGVSFELAYDARYLTVAGHEAGPFLGASPLYAADDDPQEGRIGIGISQRAGASGADGSGVVARVEFALSVDAPNEADLLFEIQATEAADPDGITYPMNQEPLTIRVNAVPNPVPVLSSISINQAEQGDAVQVIAMGEAFFAGTTTVGIDGEGVEVAKLEIIDFRTLSFDLIVDPEAPAGERQITLTNGLPGGGTSEALPFTVIEVDPRPAPVLTEIQPASGVAGETVDLVLTGEGFVDGVSKLVISGSGLVIESETIDSEAQISAVLRIESDAAPGNRDVFVTTRPPGGGTSQVLSFEILDAPRPDLTVQQVLAPEQRFFGELMQISWTVANTGEGAATGNWFDRIYLSPDPVLDTDNAVAFGTVENLATLTAAGTGGSAYANQVSLQIPRGFTGTYYVFVVTDAFRKVKEGDELNNVISASAPLTIEPPPLPDLQVSSIAVQGNAFTRDTLTVSWTVKNMGDGPVDSDDWVDSIFLSEDNQIDFVFVGAAGRIAFRDPLLGVQPAGGVLVPGESYTNSKEIVLPEQMIGELSLIVYTDIKGSGDGSDGSIYEFNNNFNNWEATPIQVTLRPPPDLIISEIDVPAAVTSGEEIEVTWTAKNAGAGETIATSWWDAVYLSEDDSFDPDEDLRLASINRSGGRLAPDSVYAASANIKLDHTLDGAFTLFVVIDVEENVFENDAEDNNAGTLPSSITLTPNPPDLLPAGIQLLGTARSGQSVDVTWSVQNNGPGITYEGVWTDYVFLTESPTFDPAQVKPVGIFSHTGELPPDSSYEAVASIDIDDGVSGPMYLHVFTDFNNTVFEHTEEAEGNNLISLAAPVEVELSPWADLQVSSVTVTTPESFQAGNPIIVSWRVENAGEAMVSREWDDVIYISSSSTFSLEDADALRRVTVDEVLAPGGAIANSIIITLSNFTPAGTYYIHVVTDNDDTIYEHTDNANNLGVSAGFDVAAYPPVDVVLENLFVPADGATGESLVASWDASNTGQAPTLNTRWQDAVYLSEDRELDSEDLFLQSYQRRRPLAEGERYTGTLEIELPHDAAGTFWVIVQSLVQDDDPSNNVLVSSNQVEIVQSPAPDLAVSAFDAPTGGFSGHLFEVSWEITNAGTVPTPPQWYESLHLSRDSILNAGDIRLATFLNQGVLAPGETRKTTREVELPPRTSGAFSLIFQTDSNNTVFESDESNNKATGTGDAGASAVIEVTTAPPSDLAISNIAFDTEAVPGEEITVTWTIKNTSPNPASGIIRDAVYISTDDSFQVQDPLLGILEQQISLPGGEATQMSMKMNLAKTFRADLEGNISEELPGVLPGQYKILVRSDIRDAIPELDESNNERASIAEINVMIPALALDKSTAGRLINLSNKYYALPASETQDIRLTADSPEEELDIYVSYDSVPALNDNAFNTRTQQRDNRTVILPRQEAGTYYVLLNTPSGDANVTEYTLSTESLSFSVEDLGNTTGGTGGKVSSTIRGAGFEQGTKLFLEPAGSAGKGETEIFEGILTAYTNSTHIDVRWELIDVPVGSYDVVLERTTGERVRVESGFEVEALEPSNITVQVSGSEIIRSGRDAVYDIVVRNDGNTNADFVFLTVAVPFYQTMVLESHDFYDRPLPPEAIGEFEDFPAGVQIDSIGVILAMNKDIRPGQQLSARVTLPNVVSDVGEIPIYIEAFAATKDEFMLTDLHNFGEYTLELQNITSQDNVDPELVSFLSDAWLETLVNSYYTTWLFGEVEQPEGLQRLHYRPTIILSANKKREAEKNFRCETFGLIVAVSLEKHIKNLVDKAIKSIKLPDSIRKARIAIKRTWLGRRIMKHGTTIALGLGKIFGGVGHVMLGIDVGALATCEVMVRAGYIVMEELKYLTTDDCDDLDPYALIDDVATQIFNASLDALNDIGLDYAEWFSSIVNAVKGRRISVGGFVTSFIRTIAQKTGTVLCGLVQFAVDPNDIIGPLGYGDQKWITRDNPLPYTIRFENDPEKATAAAQLVTITQTPDSTLNINSFRLGSFGFGSFVFDVPPNRAFYSTRVDVSDSLGVWVDVSAGLDVTSNTLFWNLQSIDPATGLPPNDPLAGFLPVNDSTGIGEGFVTYTVRADTAAMSGERIDAEAEIVFDINEPIITPPIFNTLDTTAPVSQVTEQVTQIDSTAFLLRWTGQDDPLGAGISSYNLYFAEDDSAFVLYDEGISDTVMVFTGEPGKTYRFFTQAIDNVGNAEPLKLSADQVVRVSTEDVAGVGVPEQFELFPNYPNPFNPSTTIRFALPAAEHIRMDIYNILGQRVATLVDAERNAGYHTIQWNGTGFAGHRLSSGVYFYSLSAGQNHAVRKMVMVK